MNPVRKRRLWLAVLLLAAAGVAGTLVALALQENMTYLHTPTETVEGTVPQQGAFRLGGVVKEGSIRRSDGTLQVDFVVTDRLNDYPVRYVGILPDLFREGQSVIARGRLEGGLFAAEEVLAKHDETYMPKEVADKIAEAHARGAQQRAEGTLPSTPLPSTPPGG